MELNSVLGGDPSKIAYGFGALEQAELGQAQNGQVFWARPSIAGGQQKELPICEGDGPKKSEGTVRNLTAFQGAVYPCRACLARNTEKKSQNK